MYMYLQYVTNVTFDFTNFTIEFTIYGPQARNFPGGCVTSRGFRSRVFIQVRAAGRAPTDYVRWACLTQYRRTAENLELTRNAGANAGAPSAFRHERVRRGAVRGAADSTQVESNVARERER